jgi:hypothetical protein
MDKTDSKYGKNLQKVKDMVDGTYGRKIVVGEHSVGREQTRAIGEKWVDSEGIQWEQKDGYQVKGRLGGTHYTWDMKCKDCGMLCSGQTYHEKIYKKYGRCNYCQMNFQAELEESPLRWFAWVRSQELMVYDEFERVMEDVVEENAKMDEKPVWDKTVANALANSNVEMTIQKNKN